MINETTVKTAAEIAKKCGLSEPLPEENLSDWALNALVYVQVRTVGEAEPGFAYSASQAFGKWFDANFEIVAKR